MTIDRFIDRYNSSKVWLVKRTKCGHYWLAQEVCGFMVVSWQRVRVDQMLNIVAGD